MLIVTNPVNSTVPIARKVFQAAGCYDARRLFGVTTLDVCRANTFVAEKMDVPPENVSVPVVGGHAGATILPLLSQCSHDVVTKLGDEKSLTELTTRIQVRRQGSSSAFPALHFALCMRCVLHALRFACAAAHAHILLVNAGTHHMPAHRCMQLCLSVVAVEGQD